VQSQHGLGENNTKKHLTTIPSCAIILFSENEYLDDLIKSGGGIGPMKPGNLLRQVLNPTELYSGR
jgi:hypothetical protein